MVRALPDGFARHGGACWEMAGRIKVAKLNVDRNRETAAKYDIMSIPTVILFIGGEVSRQVVGALPKESIMKELGLLEQEAID